MTLSDLSEEPGCRHPGRRQPQDGSNRLQWNPIYGVWIQLPSLASISILMTLSDLSEKPERRHQGRVIALGPERRRQRPDEPVETG
jgi:hypothetical protein